MRKGPNGEVWLNLGCGRKQSPFMVNIDGNVFYRPDIWIDIRVGLPFPTETVDGIFACHVFEHFYWNELRRILAECFRVLKNGGGLRFLVPSVELAIDNYVKGNASWFPDFPHSFTSIGGKFMNFLFCDGNHRLCFDLGFAEEVLRNHGFVQVAKMKPAESRVFPSAVLQPLESGIGEVSLIVEATKG
jgi:prepilin-type processing-associated H-X9-DG protein